MNLVLLQLIARKAEFEITNSPDNPFKDIPILEIALKINLEIPITAQQEKVSGENQIGIKM